MSRSEERVASVPLMNMMHLIVNRRQVPNKKTSSSVNDTLNNGLATFGLESQESDIHKPQQILKHPPRRTYKHPELDSLQLSLRNYVAEGVDFQQALREATNSASGDGHGDERTLGGNRRIRRSSSLDGKQLRHIRLEPTLTTSLSWNETRTVAPLPENLTVDDSTGKFAYISLDGRLINAELATSVASIGGTLGEEEAQAWEDFAPMQRVLIVAVSAAAAAAAKHRNGKEIDGLLKTVKNRVLRIRQHRILAVLASLFNIILSSLQTFLWTLVTALGVTSLWSLLRWSGMLRGRLKLLPSMWSQENELFSLQQELSELCKQTNTNPNHSSEPLKAPESLADRGSPKTAVLGQPLRSSFDGDNMLTLQEASSSTKPSVVRAQGESQLCRDSPVNKDVKEEEAKWYVNPMVETSEDFYNISTPERCNSMFSVCTPAVQGSFEWEVLTSSFGSREIDASTELSPIADSALTTPTQLQTTMSNDGYQMRSQMMLDDGAVHQELVAMRTLCAAIVLDLRKRMLAVLDKEASMVMAALEPGSVKDVKSQLASMNFAVASCWNASVPKALAALRLSPSEFDSWLLNEAQGANSWIDASKSEESVGAWRQYLEKNDVSSEGAEKKSPNTFNLSESTVSQSGANELFQAPLANPQNEDRRIGVPSGDLACPRDSSEDSIDQLLEETDEATATVAMMESQICKRSGCSEQDWENQVKGCEDVTELVKQLQSKEVEVADLKKGQQALLEAKNKEIEELKEDFKRRDAELDKRLAAVETTKAESADRLAMVEEICREKDSALSSMKQGIQALESKVQKSRVYQSPKSRRHSTSSTPSSSSGYGTSQKQRFSDRNAPSGPGSDPIVEHLGRFQKEGTSNKLGHVRNAPDISIERQEELTDDGRSAHGYDQETSHEYCSSPAASTVGEDDCSVNSLAFSETEVESRFGSEYCSSGDDSRLRGCKDRLSGTTGSGSHNRTIPKQKSASSDLRKAVTSTASSVRSLTRSQSDKNYTSATKAVTGKRDSTKHLQKTYPGEIKKATKDPNSPRTSNLKGLGSVAANHHRSSSLDMNFKPYMCASLETSGLSVGMSDSGSPNSQDNTAMKRKRWV